MSVRLGNFDDIESANVWGIREIMSKIEETAPTGTKVNWEFPGYVSIVLSNGTEIAFGESLESDSGYSWNDFDSDGTNRHADSFNDLKDIKAIVDKLWEQTAHIIENKGE
jgi:hypothetical protein